MRIPRLKVPDDTAAALRRGHPWVFRDRPFRAPPGAVVDLTDDRDQPVAWGIYDEGPIAVRVLGRGEAPDLSLVGLIKARIEAADRLRQRLCPPETDCMRVVNGEGDGLPGIIVDRYGELAVLRIYSKAWEVWLDALVDAIRGLGWATTVFRRLGVGRVDGSEGGVALHGATPPDSLIVNERGMKLLVRPHVGQKTGLFLDQREHRALIRAWAADREVANLFSYNGGFSVAAALGGARRVISVDIAPAAIEDARAIFRLNGIDPDRHGFEVADAFQWKPANKLDLMVVDPPSLAHDKATEASARRAYKSLHTRIAPQIAIEGLLATSSCTARLALDAWQRIVREGLQDVGDWSWHHVSCEPPDHPVALGHPEGRYLKFALLRRRAP